MSIRKRIRNFRNWCPQPSKPFPANFLKVSPLIVTVAVLAEILILLVAPITYYALLVPKPSNLYVQQEYPLTNSQIRAAWPSLPTAQEIVNSGVYGFINTADYTIDSNSTATQIYLTSKPHWWDNSSVTLKIENETLTNVPNMLHGGLTPRYYQIYLQLNNTIWINIPENDLTNPVHQPSLPSVRNSGFSRTGLPTSYVVIAVTTVVVTLLAGIGYLLYKRGQSVKHFGEINYGVT
jgi:hypothetical protein